MKSLFSCQRIVLQIFCLVITVFFALILFSSGILAAEASKNQGFLGIKAQGPSQVEINGDKVEVSISENKVVAEGNVSVKRDDVTLLSDHMEYFRDTQIALAEGHVALIRKEGRMEGDRLRFDFGAMKGEFIDAEFSARPLYGVGKKISKVDENHIVVENGYVTTCDLDHPHFRLTSKKTDIYPQQKATARNVVFKVGEFPLFYLPKYTQDLREKKPVFQIIPGYRKEWGPFLLIGYRYHLTDNVRGTLHTDYRFFRGFGGGVDLDYKTEEAGTGIIKTYFLNEKSAVQQKEKRVTEKAPGDIVDPKRYEIEFRHKWSPDKQTTAIAEFYKSSDSEFLKDYKPWEYEHDTSPPTYFLLSRNLTSSTVSVRADARVNPFTTTVERLPELNYNLSDTEINETGFYFSDASTYSNLTKEFADSTDIRLKTIRMDTLNQLSYPFKISFIELRPFVGGRQTYYSRTINSEHNGEVRNIFLTGSDVSTKFYRLFEVNTNKWGLNINRLRHVVTPSVAYFFDHEPTLADTLLDQYDSIDGLKARHGMKFSLENKLQTKRNNQNCDLFRLALGSDFLLKEDAGKGGFNNVTADMDVRPYQWLGLYLDSVYDTIKDHLQIANTDVSFNDEKGKWYFRFGKRYAFHIDDQITAEWGITLNPKWQFVVYQRFEEDKGKSMAQQYRFRRDLHCWWVDFSAGKRQGAGNEIWIVFTSKDFPDMGLDFNAILSRKKPGSQRY